MKKVLLTIIATAIFVTGCHTHGDEHTHRHADGTVHSHSHDKDHHDEKDEKKK